MYHGTNSTFTQFDKDKWNTKKGFGDFGVGFYFTSIYGVAKYYTLKSNTDRILLNLFINIRKPFVIELNWEKLSNETKKRYKSLVYLQDYQKEIIKDVLNDDENNRPSKSISKGFGDYIFKDILIDNNYDGVIVHRINKYENKHYDPNFEDNISLFYEIVAFEPTQIKLADGTNTTFYPNNPDIRFEDGGYIESIEKQDKEQMESQFGKNNI